MDATLTLKVRVALFIVHFFMVIYTGIDHEYDYFKLFKGEIEMRLSNYNKAELVQLQQKVEDELALRTFKKSINWDKMSSTDLRVLELHVTNEYRKQRVQRVLALFAQNKIQDPRLVAMKDAIEMAIENRVSDSIDDMLDILDCFIED